MMISEVMASGVDGEYAELLNLGPGAANLEALALQGPDAVVRPLLAAPPPLPCCLRRARARLRSARRSTRGCIRPFRLSLQSCAHRPSACSDAAVR